VKSLIWDGLAGRCPKCWLAKTGNKYKTLPVEVPLSYGIFCHGNSSLFKSSRGVFRSERRNRREETETSPSPMSWLDLLDGVMGDGDCGSDGDGNGDGEGDVFGRGANQQCQGRDLVAHGGQLPMVTLLNGRAVPEGCCPALMGARERRYERAGEIMGTPIIRRRLWGKDLFFCCKAWDLSNISPI
jgi:hypothetical protein